LTTFKSREARLVCGRIGLRGEAGKNLFLRAELLFSRPLAITM
jgi:hypothetical protein